MTARSDDLGSGSLAGAAATAPPHPPIAWYLGRDGQQFGPVDDIEFRRLFESGQLLPTDLVWREGLAEWQPVATLQLEPTEAPPPPPSPPAPLVRNRSEQGGDGERRSGRADIGHRPVQRHSTGDRGTARSNGNVNGNAQARQDAPSHPHEPQPKRGRRRRSAVRVVAWVAIVAFFAVTLGAAYLVVAGDRNLLMMAKAILPSFGDGVVKTAPLGGFASTTEATDAALQKTRLWQVLKKYHPEWYAERVRDASEATRAGKPDKDVAVSMMQSVVALRRKYAGDATAAPYERLKTIAVLFASNLKKMRSENIDTCYQFVSAGEGAPAVVALLQSPENTSALQAQLVEIFEAAVEGQRVPRVYPTPKPQDYSALVTILAARGWKNADLQLFSDSAALAKASPDTVCRLVTESFESQLSITDQDLQLRLLVDSLKPVVAG